MKKNRFGLILISLLMMAAGVTVMYSCTGDETPTTTLAPDDPADGSTTTAEPDDSADGSTTTAEPEDNPADGSTTTAEPDDPADGSTTTAKPDDSADGSTTTAKPDDVPTEPLMWNEKKDVVTHLSFDRLATSDSEGNAGVSIFKPGRAAHWDGVADMSDSRKDHLRFIGWLNARGGLGAAGYRIDEGEIIWKDSFCTAASGKITLNVLIDLRNLTDTHKVTVYYKNAQDRTVKLYVFDVVLDWPSVQIPAGPTVTVTPQLPEGYTSANNTYTCQDDSILYTFDGKTADDFTAVSDYYTKEGYTVYHTSEKAGNKFTTFVKENAMAHVYWLSNRSELNIALSATAAATLPPVTPAVTTGDVPCTVYQVQDTIHDNGMGYIIQLSDGSYIVYDGSFYTQADDMLAYMQEHHKGEGKPLVRAWVLTHSHGDHYPSFQYFARRIADAVTVEYVIAAPLRSGSYNFNDEEIYFSTPYFKEDIARLGATAVYAHTGMEFNFCDLKLEVLLSPDDLYKKGNIGNFNNTSIVTRLYDDTYSALFTGDIGSPGTAWMEGIYSSYLKSDMCQSSHHGVEDAPLSFYDRVQASILFYPCHQSLYDTIGRGSDVRFTLEKKPYTKEILIQSLGAFVREWGTTFAADAPLSMPNYSSDVSKETQYDPDRLQVNKTTFEVGEPILVTATGSGKDWVGICEAGKSNSLRWWYLAPVTSSQNYVNVTSGVEFDMLSTPANYNSKEGLKAGEYTIVIKSNGTLIASVDITIVGGEDDPSDPGVTPNPGDTPDGADRLQVNKTTFEVGESIMITAIGDNYDWVGVFKQPNVTGGSVRWWRLQDNADEDYKVAPSGVAFDALTLEAENTSQTPIAAGTWYINLIDKDNGVVCVASIEITITEPTEDPDPEQPEAPDPEQPESTDRLTVNKTTFVLGEPIMITAVGDQSDWFGIFAQPNTASGPKKWWVFPDHPTASYDRVPSGEAFDAMTQPGNYSFELTAGTWYINLIDKDNGTVCVESIEITVVNPSKVIWKNADGTVLETDENIAADTKIEYNGEEPTKESDSSFNYVFAGWQASFPENEEGTVIYTAAFNAYEKDRLSVNKTEFVVGEAIMVTAIGDNNDWIGVFTKPNAITGSKQWWAFPSHSDASNKKAPSGEAFDATTLVGNVSSFTFTAGTWYIGLIDKDTGSNVCVDYIEITVTEPAGSAE